MAIILPFRRHEKERSGSSRTTSAEIVFFTGVRVEYHDEPPKPAGDGAPRRSGAGRRNAKRAVSA